MASTKKSGAKKTAPGKKGATMRNLTKGKSAMTAAQLETVKGGQVYPKRAY
jgi:hypothetical protein